MSTTPPSTVDGYTAAEWANFYNQAQAQHQDELALISAWQKHQTQDQITIFAVETADGTIKHATAEYHLANTAAQMYDGARTVTSTRTPWKPVTQSHATTTGGN